MHRRQNAKKVVFKPYEMNHMLPLPASLEELIPEKHLVRLMNETIEQARD